MPEFSDLYVDADIELNYDIDVKSAATHLYEYASDLLPNPCEVDLIKPVTDIISDMEDWEDYVPDFEEPDLPYCEDDDDLLDAGDLGTEDGVICIKKDNSVSQKGTIRDDIRVPGFKSGTSQLAGSAALAMALLSAIF